MVSVLALISRKQRHPLVEYRYTFLHRRFDNKNGEHYYSTYSRHNKRCIFCSCDAHTFGSKGFRFRNSPAGRHLRRLTSFCAWPGRTSPREGRRAAPPPPGEVGSGEHGSGRSEQKTPPRVETSKRIKDSGDSSAAKARSSGYDI